MAIAVVLLAVAAFATPTKPFVVDGFSFPYTFLVANAAGDLTVTTTEPASGSKVVAKAQYNRSNADIGWDYLSLEGDGRYHAGYLEGYLTADTILLNGLAPPLGNGATGQWVTDHIAYMQNKSKELREVEQFWARVDDMLSFMEGIAAGASAAAPNGSGNITFVDVFMLNFAGTELPDVETAVAVQGQLGGSMFHNKLAKKGGLFRKKGVPTHCSALIRVTPTDLYVAQDTWDVYTSSVYRIHKVYNFYGNVVAMSSYPGYIASSDDWYMTGRQLAVQETSLSVFNVSLYTAVVPQTVSEFLRVMAACWLANNGEEWTLYFSRENSGTYNNQYMVVDFKLYAPGSSIVPGTLWIAEQVPGIVARGDESAVLAATGYWASYNIPYFPEIFNISGNLQQEQEYGSFFSYTKYARPEIFARNQSSIMTLADMQHMMRYNDYEHDPLSAIPNCTGAPNNQCLTPRTAMLSIASRGDLMPLFSTTQEFIDNYGPLYDYMATGCFGAIDSKIAAWSNRHTLKAYVIAGPTNDQQPTFVWNTKGCAGTPTPAQTPTTVNYPWVEFNRVKDPLRN
jgi:hypothetical protein